MAEITLKNIRKVYPGEVTAVRDFNLEIADKEFIVFVGPSGCGKSTTLRMIAGLEDITEGDLFIGGHRVNDVLPKERDIAMVFQNYSLYPHMTVYKNMAFALKLRKMDKTEIDRRVREAAKILGIEPLLARNPRALSGGERQRVALGRAMVREPSAFLLDEPLSNLDAKLRAGMRAELIKLHRRLDTTFVYVTHDQTEAMTMGDRIVIMKDGLIQQVDTPQNLYNRPCNAFVAGFIGSPPMNFISGTLEVDGGFHVRVGGERLPIVAEKLSAGRRSDRLDEYAGKPVIVGIRPEDVYIGEDALRHWPGSVISAEVDLAEQMGSEIYLYLEHEAGKLTARVPAGSDFRPGQRVSAAIDTAKIHLFDCETEEAILT